MKKIVKDGTEYFKVTINGKEVLLPVVPEEYYQNSMCWSDFLGLTDIEKLTQGMSPVEKERERNHVIANCTKEIEAKGKTIRKLQAEQEKLVKRVQSLAGT